MYKLGVDKHRVVLGLARLGVVRPSQSKRECDRVGMLRIRVAPVNGHFGIVPGESGADRQVGNHWKLHLEILECCLEILVLWRNLDLECFEWRQCNDLFLQELLPDHLPSQIQRRQVDLHALARGRMSSKSIHILQNHASEPFSSHHLPDWICALVAVSLVQHRCLFVAAIQLQMDHTRPVNGSLQL